MTAMMKNFEGIDIIFLLYCIMSTSGIVYSIYIKSDISKDLISAQSSATVGYFGYKRGSTNDNTK